VTLDGSVTDDDQPNPPGATTTRWSKLSGPGTVTFADPSAIDTTVSFSVAGTYTLHLLAFDGLRAAADDLTIAVEQAGDLDGDRDVDIEDVGMFVACLTGTDQGPPPAGCDLADVDEDDDVDMSDFGLVQRCLNGSGTPAKPDCADAEAG